MKRIIFTLCNCEYLCYALECERSFYEHHSADWTFYIMLVDHPHPSDSELDKLKCLLSSSQSQILTISSLFRQSKEVSLMSLYYDITEYSTSVKPWVFAHLMKELSPRSVTYIDPDIQFFGCLDLDKTLVESNVEFDCILTPHILTNSLNSHQQPTLKNIRSCGSYNFGFVHFENTAKSRIVVDFWAEELKFNSLMWLDENLFTDQRYGDLFPSLCHVHVSRDPGLNVAYWNIQERVVIANSNSEVNVHLVRDDKESGITRPLIFFHYSGLRASGHPGISKHMGKNPRTPRGANKTVESLINNYNMHVLINKSRVDQLSIQPGPSYLGCINYEVNGKQHIYSLNTQERRDLNRYFYNRVNSGRAGLPPSRFIDNNLFILALHGATASKGSHISLQSINIFSYLNITLPGINLQTLGTEPALGPRCMAEINIVGYANFSFGIGRITALIVKGFSSAGIRFSFTPDPAQAKPVMDTDLAWLESLAGLNHFNRNAPTLFLVNADQYLHYVNTGIANHCISKTCNLGYWWWELESPAPVHAEAAPYLDKILAPTRFIYDSLSHVIDETKLVYAPLDYRDLYNTIYSDSRPDSNESSNQEFLWRLGLDLNISSFKTLTLNVFDFNSCIERKNPALLVDIFSEPSMQDHALLMKCSGGVNFPSKYQNLIERISSMPNVFLLDRCLDQIDLRRLFDICMIYASPHRAEGLGLNIIEADAYGLATVFTDYGGITEYPFYGSGPHYPCQFKPVEINLTSDIYYPYMRSLSETVRWAEPDPHAFAQALQECMSGVSNTKFSTIAGGTTQTFPTIIDVLTSMLSAGFSGRAIYQGMRPFLNPSCDSLVLMPTNSDAKRQLYLAFRKFLLTTYQGGIAFLDFLKVLKHVGWLVLLNPNPLRRVYRAIAVRRRYALTSLIFRK